MKASEEIGRQIGRKIKAPKGTIKIESDKGWLRLRFSCQGKRYAFALGLPDSKVNRKVAEQRAKQIELDILSRNFDSTLEKYKPKIQAALHKQGWLTVVCLFQWFMEYKAKGVTFDC